MAVARVLIPFNGIHIETTRSGHGIQDDEPELVLMAIRFVLDRVRAQ